MTDTANILQPGSHTPNQARLGSRSNSRVDSLQTENLFDYKIYEPRKTFVSPPYTNGRKNSSYFNPTWYRSDDLKIMDHKRTPSANKVIMPQAQVPIDVKPIAKKLDFDSQIQVAAPTKAAEKPVPKSPISEARSHQSNDKLIPAEKKSDSAKIPVDQVRKSSSHSGSTPSHGKVVTPTPKNLLNMCDQIPREMPMEEARKFISVYDNLIN